MLVKATHVIGLKILTLSEGQVIGKIHDIIYDPHDNSIKAFLVEKGSIFSEPKVVLMTDVEHIGKDALMVANEHVVKNASEANGSIADIAKQNTYLTQTKIVTEEGSVLGTVCDLYFDAKTGHVDELEVTEGGLNTLRSGLKRVKIVDVVTIGKDATIVKSYTTEEIEEQRQAQGIQGAFNKARMNISSFFQQTSHSIQQTEDKLRQNVSRNASQKAKQLEKSSVPKDIATIAQKQTELAKEQTQDVIAKGKSIAKREYKKAKEQTQDVMSQGRSVTKRKYKQAKNTLEQKREENVVGKYLTVNVLGENDTIIAKRGEMITHQLLKIAEDAHTLDKVLNNTSEQPVR